MHTRSGREQRVSVANCDFENVRHDISAGGPAFSNSGTIREILISLAGEVAMLSFFP